MIGATCMLGYMPSMAACWQAVDQHECGCSCWQVKSDRHVDDDHDIEELQHHTVKHIRREHHEEDEVTVEKVP